MFYVASKLEQQTAIILVIISTSVGFRKIGWKMHKKVGFVSLSVLISGFEVLKSSQADTI